MSVILDEAKNVVYQRNAAYGQPEDNFAITAELWSAYLGTPIQPEDVGMMMILLKVARQRYQHKKDNLVDIAGYAECVARLHEKSADTSTPILPLERLRAIGRLMGFQSKEGVDDQ